MIEKHAANQTSSLAELQSELRSLKTLLQSRQGQANSSSSSQTQSAADKLLAPRAGKGIPAWQLAPNTTGGGSGPSPGGSSAGSLAGSGILDKEVVEGEVGEVKEDGV